MESVHICLLSDQLLPNLIPILMDRPSRVYLVVTEEMASRERDKRMKKLLRRQNVDVRVRKKAPSTGIEQIRNFADRLAREISMAESDKGIVLNATGGTKLLSMGFVETFRASLEGYPLQVIYTDTAHRVIEKIVPLEQPAIPMESVLDVETYLMAQGARLVSAKSKEVRWRSVVEGRRDTTYFLAENCAAIGDFFSLMNGLVHGMKGKPGALSRDGASLSRPEQELPRMPRDIEKSVLDSLANAGCIYWHGTKGIRFINVKAASYIGGLWLEDFAWLSAKQVAGIRDVLCSAKIRWDAKIEGSGPENEFDLLTAHDNRLLLVECKTGADPEQAVATRLDSLGRNTGGLFGHSVLLSARKLSDTMAARCSNLGIEPLQAGDIVKLPELIARWRDGGTRPR